MQIISKYVARSWVSPVATDQEHDIAILQATGHAASCRGATGRRCAKQRQAVHHWATRRLADLSLSPPRPGQSWRTRSFRNNIGSLTNPRELLWMSAPDVTHGYSGGPIFDPRSGAVVGLVKGEVEGGYLRLVRDMPTTGIAIGPGVASISRRWCGGRCRIRR